jgi:hypothetical protein
VAGLTHALTDLADFPTGELGEKCAPGPRRRAASRYGSSRRRRSSPARNRDAAAHSGGIVNLDGRGMLVVSVARRLGSEGPLPTYCAARFNGAGPKKGALGRPVREMLDC